MNEDSVDALSRALPRRSESVWEAKRGAIGFATHPLPGKPNGAPRSEATESLHHRGSILLPNEEAALIDLFFASTTMVAISGRTNVLFNFSPTFKLPAPIFFSERLDGCYATEQ